MGKRLRLEDTGNQGGACTPAPGTAVKIAIDLSRNKWVYCVRWGGQEQRWLTTPGDRKHVEALVAQYRGCPVHLAFEACGFGYEIAWWAEQPVLAGVVHGPSIIGRAHYRTRPARIFCPHDDMHMAGGSDVAVMR